MESDADYSKRSQIESDIRSIVALVGTGVFGTPFLRPFYEPVFVSIILKLNDLLQLLSALNHRITFSDDIAEGDITDLVNKVRNAICHLRSPENLLDKESHLRFVFNVVVGKGTAFALIGKALATSDYGDDTAVCYGEHRLYLNRHLARAVNEALAVYERLVPDRAHQFKASLMFTGLRRQGCRPGQWNRKRVGWPRTGARSGAPFDELTAP